MDFSPFEYLHAQLSLGVAILAAENLRDLRECDVFARMYILGWVIESSRAPIQYVYMTADFADKVTSNLVLTFTQRQIVWLYTCIMFKPTHDVEMQSAIICKGSI